MKPSHVAALIYRTLLRPGHLDIVAAQVAGMIPKSELVEGQAYLGYCRNADCATWDADSQLFKYTRIKWQQAFQEKVQHPEDSTDSHDIFVPTAVAP